MTRAVAGLQSWASVAGGWVVQDGFAYLFSVTAAGMMAAGAAAAGLVHTVVVTAAREQSLDARLLFKPLLPSHLLISHWLKQVRGQAQSQ